MLAVSLAAAAVGAGAGSAAPRPLAVLGFQAEWAPPSLIALNAPAITLVGAQGIDLVGKGRFAEPDAKLLAQLAQAKASGRPAVLLVGNVSRTGDFAERLAYRTLRSPAATANAAAQVARIVRTEGWAGVSVDLESLAARDTAGLSRFVERLHRDLPAGDSLTICLEASRSLPKYAARGYDLAQLELDVDQVVLMTYDLHGPWERRPGPIGPPDWQRGAVATLERFVPARKVFLGVADYGYAWGPHHRTGTLTVAGARALVVQRHAKARWVKTAAEWTAKLSDGATLWWSDARSIAVRAALARRLGVHGIAVWSLGSGDPIPVSAR